MLKFILIGTMFVSTFTIQTNSYPWIKNYDSNNTIATRIKVPQGYKRTQLAEESFENWLRNLPLKPQNTPVKYWNGQLKKNQNIHAAVVDIDFIGNNLQQCIDAIIRIRAEYLWSIGKADETAFSYTCCSDKISWTKWKNGWRTKIVKKNNRDSFVWIKTEKYDDSYKNFHDYLFNIMMFAGTSSLSEDMNIINASDVNIGDAYIQGGAPGYGHGVLILDMAESSTGDKIMLLGQSYNPAENLNILKSNSDISPWFRVDFNENLYTPQWTFNKNHAMRF